MGVKLNTASGGSVSIEPSNTASNYTLTVPAQTGTVIASDSSGNVGIGTSSPSRKLHVHESAAGTNAYFQLSNAATGSGATDGLQLIVGTGGETIVAQRENAQMEFWTNNTERMRIDSSGNLLLLTATVNGNGITISPNASTADNYLMFNNTATSATNVYFRYNGSTVGNINRNTTSTTYATSSDYRLKENIAPMTGALAVVGQLKPCTYTWKIDGSSGQGFIAHELQAVVPDCVTGEKDAVDDEGNPVYQGIDTSFLVATLTAAIQELNAKVDAQAAEIALLKGQA